MTTQAGLGIRLVKCPGCRKILPESPEVSMYKCGWCGIVLEAKNKKSETSQPELPSQETDIAAEIQQDNVLGRTEDRSSTDRLTDSTREDSPPDADKVRCEDECDESVELSHSRGASDGVSGSPDITIPRSENLPLEIQESVGNSPLGRSPTSCTAGSNSSTELCISGEISLEAGCTSESSEHVGQYNPSQLHRDFILEEKNNGESESVWPEGDNFVAEVQNLPEYEDQESVLPENEETIPASSTNQIGKSSGEIKPVGLDSPSGMNSNQNHIIAPSADLVDDGSKGGSFITERTMALNSDYIRDPRRPSIGSLDSFYYTCDDEQDLSRSEVDQDLQRMDFVDTMGSSNLGDFSSELNFGPGSTVYYPTSRNYYAYDGSESSYDGVDDQGSEHVSYPSIMDKDTEELRRDGLSGNIRVNNEAERLYWETSTSHRAIHHPWIRGKYTETKTYTGRNRVRLDLHEDVSRSPFPSADHIAGRRPATISGHLHKLPPQHPDFHSSDKMDLLRTVYQLKDQLQRMQFPKPMPNRKFPEEGSFSPFSYNLLASERDMYADVSHFAGRFNRWHDRSKGYGERYNDPRMALSGEVSHFSHQASCSCLHRFSQDWHYSAQLPSCSLHYENDHHSSLSPHRYACSEPSSWDCETKSDNHRLAEIKRLQLREKYQMVKRHLRPIAGGAPVIACYHCSELLQLPVDFLLFQKRYHKLMCNACQKVLKFSFMKGTTHLIPYVPDASAPPLSEARDNKEASGGKYQQPLPHSSSCHHVQAVSCSDDYGRSFCRSCSTDKASVMSPPLDQVKRDSYNRKTSSSNSHEPIEDRKLKGILKESRRQKNGSLESVESVGPSSRMRNRGNGTTSVSETEELPPLSKPPLHLLFGYSTVSKVLER